MSALPPKADINHRERDVGFVPFCSVDNPARNTEGAHERSSLLDHHAVKKIQFVGQRPPVACTKSLYFAQKALPWGFMCKALTDQGRREAALRHFGRATQILAGGAFSSIFTKPRRQTFD
jgi:hypothetical protein